MLNLLTHTQDIQRDVYNRTNRDIRVYFDEISITARREGSKRCNRTN